MKRLCKLGKAKVRRAWCRNIEKKMNLEHSWWNSYMSSFEWKWLRLKESYQIFEFKSIIYYVSNFSRLFSKNLKIKIYKTITLPVVLYGCETWFLTLREESRLRVFENRITRRIFGPKRDENGKWRRLHNEELLGRYRKLTWDWIWIAPISRTLCGWYQFNRHWYKDNTRKHRFLIKYM